MLMPESAKDRVVASAFNYRGLPSAANGKRHLREANTCPDVKRPGATDASTPSPSASSVRSSVYFFWCNKLSHHTHSTELLDNVAGHFRLDRSVIIGWVNLYAWPLPEDRDIGDGDNMDACIQADEDRFGVASNDDEGRLAGIDRRMTDRELRDLATDPLYPWWCSLRSAQRRQSMTWLETMGALNPRHLDLKKVQNLLDRFPLTLCQLAAVHCIEPSVFEKYCQYYQCNVHPHAGSLTENIGYLVHRYPELQTTVVSHAQYLYTHNAIPVHRLAQYCDLQWEDLWTMGVRLGAWILPSDETLHEVESLILNRQL